MYTGWMLLGALLGFGVVALAWLVVRTRRQLVATRAEAEQLRAMVKQRVERPNVFSHEVRTPLALIMGAAELLADEAPGPLTERQREFVSTIESNAQRITDLAQDMLTQAKIDAELFELRLAPVDLRKLARRIVQDARRIHSAPLRLDNGGPPMVAHADPQLLGQALWNLVNNACRHARPGSTVTVAVTQGEGHGIIAVTDDGAGMTCEERDLLFEPFASSAAAGGTGLGMMITERIIDQHGGRMLVDTVPDHGTTVFFTVPLGARDIEEEEP